MKELEIESWRQFIQFAEALYIGEPGSEAYAFRGLSVAEWGLQPSLLRKLGDGVAEERALKVERKIQEEFESQAHQHLATNTLLNTTDVVGWWTLMQHHGAPTRLLDWTRSMFVAAYFAVTREPTMAGAVWIVHTNTLHQKMTERYENVEFPKTVSLIKERFLQPSAPPVLFFMDRKMKTNRIIAQQGAFSICQNVLGDHGEILNDVMPEQSDKELFGKFVIPAPLKTEFLRNLRGMNITANSLFPGLDGLGMSINELIQVMQG